MGQQGINDFTYPQLTSFNNIDPYAGTNVDTNSTPGQRNPVNPINPSNPTSTDGYSPGKFDIQKFNKDFEDRIQQTKETDKILEGRSLEQLNKQVIEKKPYELSIAEIFVAIKDSWFGLLDDLLQQQFYVETFTKQNRLFYIGLTIVIIVIMFYLYDIIIDGYSDNSNSNPNLNLYNKKIVEIHHIYHNKNNQYQFNNDD